MAKSTEDHIEDLVRRRLSDHHASAGLAKGEIAQDVLFLLPSEFTRMYGILFDEAFDQPVKPTGDGGKDEGRVKASGKPADAMRARSMGAAAGGKRFVAGTWPVRDEKATAIKASVDRKLVRIIEGALRELSELRRNGREPHHDDRKAQNRCGECGAFQSPRWVRCPFH